MAVSQECLDNIESKTCEIAQHIKDRAKYSLSGGEPCCDTRAQDLRWYLASYLLNNYGNQDAENPKRAYLSDKMVECLCSWVDRQFTGGSSGGGGGGGRIVAEYNLDVPATPVITPFVGTLAPINGTINITSSIGSWSAGTLGDNEIVYGDNTPKSFNVTVNVAVSTASVAQPIFYGYYKVEGGVPTTSSLSPSFPTPGDGTPQPTATFTWAWTPSQATDSFVVMITQGQAPQQTLTLTTFNVTIREQ